MFQLNTKHFQPSTALCFLFFLSLSISIKAQDKVQSSIVKADNTWSTEIIPFPVDWLPKLTYKGFEELRFAPNWNKTDHDQFWTLAMAWQVETQTLETLENLHYNFNHYFTELMKPNHWAQEFPDPKLVLKDLEVTKSGKQFKGSMTFFDGFHTGKIITVNILGHQTLCEATGNSVILFRISPQSFDQSIWATLNKITINDEVCLD